jgi:hypothetical protein
VNEISGLSLVLGIFPQTITFAGESIEPLIEPGLYSKK